MSESAADLSQAVLARLTAGDGVGAERLAKRLTIVQPHNARARFLLANSLCVQGRLLDALDPIESAVALEPSEPDFVTGKAQILARLQRTSLAIEWYRKAIALRPSQALVCELGWALLSEGLPTEAIAVLERYADIFPPGGRPYALMAQALTECGRFEEAEPLWKDAARGMRNPTALLRQRAKAEACGGRLDVSERLLREAIAAVPSDPTVYADLARLRRITPDDGSLVDAMEARRTSAADSVRSELCYALGKSYHDLGEYELAIRRFDEANDIQFRLSQITRRLDPKAWRQFIDQQIGFFSKDRVGKLAPGGDPSALPIFVVGMIRSGTTLTEQILSCHPLIAAGGETTFWPDYREELQGRNGFDASAARRLAGMYLRILDTHAGEACHVIEKNPANVLLSPMIHCVFPNAKILHVRRHAVDNLLSIWMTPMQTGLPFVYNRRNLVFAYREYLRLAAHAEQVLPDDRFRTFQYEDLTSRPTETVPSMLSFLGVEMDEACLHPEKNPRAVRTPSFFQARQGINTGSQDRWKNYEPWLGEFAELLASPDAKGVPASSEGSPDPGGSP